MGRFSAWESVGYGALVDIVRMGRGLGQGGSVTGARGVAEVGVFGRNLGDYGGRWSGFLPQKTRDSQKVGVYYAQTFHP